MNDKNPYFSVIIPTLNEERGIEKTIESVLKQSFKNFEIIVVDGKSTDSTIKLAKRYCKVFISPLRGQANQINYALEHTKGHYICVLDADTRLSKNVLEEVYNCVSQDEKIVVGSCNWKFDDTDPKFRMLAYLVNFATRLFKTTAIFHFAKKSIFKKIRYNPSFIAYDIEFMMRARKFGEFKIINDIYFITSTRRYKKEGFLKTLMKQTMIVLDILLRTSFTEKVAYSFGNYK